MAKKINFKLKHMELLLIVLVLSIGAGVLYFLQNRLNKKQNQNQNQNPPSETFISQASQDKVLMLFYADWCGYSRQFLPVWDEITQNVNIRTERINVDENSDLSADFQISALPTLYLVDGQSRTKYEGPRTKSAILNFVSTH